MADQRLVDLIKRFRSEAMELMGDYDHIDVHLVTRCGQFERCAVTVGSTSYLRLVGEPDQLDQVAKSQYGYQHVKTIVEGIEFSACLNEEESKPYLPGEEA